MTAQLQPPVRRRLVLAFALSLCALALSGVQMFGGKELEPESGVRPNLKAIGATLDTLYERFGIDRGALRTWMARAAGVETGRMEQRIPVGRSFDAIQFNLALARALSPTGVHVVASEHSRETSVTMHIVSRRMTIWSVSFVLDSDR